MIQPMATQDREQAHAVLGPKQAAATDEQVLQATEAIRRIRDPQGPTGWAYGQLRLDLAALAPALIARILELEDDKD